MSGYYEQKDITNTHKLNRLLNMLPPYCKDYFRGIEMRTSSQTRLSYFYDLNIFFEYLVNCQYTDISKKDITLEMLEHLSPMVFEQYMHYLKCYCLPGKSFYTTNTRTGISRKISSIKSFYNYFYRTGKVTHNPTLNLQMPKILQKEIIRLEPDEIVLLLDSIEEGRALTEWQLNYHAKTKNRDLAIMAIFLGTGIRASECAGLDLNEVDFKHYKITVTRKGGNRSILYFSDEISDILLRYYQERIRIRDPFPGSENAFFLSLQRKRISVGAIENILKKFSQICIPTKNITPHKLRSTYGTNLYRATRDIYLVADILGHSDVNTTKKHYAAIEEDRREHVRNKIHLRSSTEFR